MVKRYYAVKLGASVKVSATRHHDGKSAAIEAFGFATTDMFVKVLGASMTHLKRDQHGRDLGAGVKLERVLASPIGWSQLRGD